jgi:hypothetical protein
MTEFTAHSDGRVIVPDEPVQIPQGRPLRVRIEEVQEKMTPEPRREALLRLAAEAEALKPDLPSDLAMNLDHYLCGAPKR